MEWNEIIVLLLSEAGIFALLFKLFTSWYEKKQEREHELEKLKIITPAKSLRNSIIEMDVVYDMLDRVISQYRANTALYVKINNGKTFADKTHIWKYSAVMYSGDMGGSLLRNDIQNRLISECPKVFSRLESDGFCYNDSIDSKSANVLEQRVLNAGYSSYLMVSTDKCFKALLICWDASKIGADGVDITKKQCELIKAELMSVEDILPT